MSANGYKRFNRSYRPNDSRNNGNLVSEPHTTSMPSEKSDLLPLKNLRKAPRPMMGNETDLLQLVLAVRSLGGRVKRALNDLKPTSDAFSFDYAATTVRSICILLGCSRLDNSVSYENTVNAFNRYVALSKPQCNDHSSLSTSSKLGDDSYSPSTIAVGDTVGNNNIDHPSDTDDDPTLEPLSSSPPQRQQGSDVCDWDYQLSSDSNDESYYRAITNINNCTSNIVSDRNVTMITAIPRTIIATTPADQLPSTISHLHLPVMDTAMAAYRLSDEVCYDDYESNQDEKQLSVVETQLEQEGDEDETQLEQEGDEDETQLEQEGDEVETQLEQEQEGDEDETQLEQEEDEDETLEQEQEGDEDETQSEEVLLDQPSSSGEVDPLPGSILSLSDLYYSFWEFVARLLEFAYHPRRRCAECLQTIEGRVGMLTSLSLSLHCHLHVPTVTAAAQH
jgi:hypothetical protein